jgi:hypothetical protein
MHLAVNPSTDSLDHCELAIAAVLYIADQSFFDSFRSFLIGDVSRDL